MPIRAQSADGMMHEFPDDTSPEVVDRAMKKYATDQSFKQSLPGQAVEFGKGLVYGGLQGAEELPGAMPRLMQMGGHALEGLGVGDPEAIRQREQLLQQQPRRTLTGGLQAEGEAGKLGQNIGQFLAPSAVSPGSWGARIATALFGGAGADVGAHLDEPGKEGYGQIIGGFLGALLPVLAGRVVSPVQPTARHAADVQRLAQEGVTDLTAGQRVGSRGLRYMEEHLGESPLAGEAAGERLRLPYEQFTGAALARIGEVYDAQAPDLTATVHRAGTRVGNQFDALAARNDAALDQQYINQIVQAQNDYNHLFVDPARRPIVENTVEHAFNKLIRSRTMTGAEYRSERSRIERLRRATNDPEVNLFLADVRNAMDDLMERNIAANNPADLGAWQAVRNQYRNLLVIEMATTGQGTGNLITPAKLRQATVSQHGRRNYARGQGPFAELARAGENVIGRLPQSGTAPRMLTQTGAVRLGIAGAQGR